MSRGQQRKEEGAGFTGPANEEIVTSSGACDVEQTVFSLEVLAMSDRIFLHLGDGGWERQAVFANRDHSDAAEL